MSGRTDLDYYPPTMEQPVVFKGVQPDFIPGITPEPIMENVPVVAARVDTPPVKLGRPRKNG